MADYKAIGRSSRSWSRGWESARASCRIIEGKEAAEKAEGHAREIEAVLARLQGMVAQTHVTEAERRRKVAEIEKKLELLKIVTSSNPNPDKRTKASREISHLTSVLGAYKVADVLKIEHLLDENMEQIKSILEEAAKDIRAAPEPAAGDEGRRGRPAHGGVHGDARVEDRRGMMPAPRRATLSQAWLEGLGLACWVRGGVRGGRRAAQRQTGSVTRERATVLASSLRLGDRLLGCLHHVLHREAKLLEQRLERRGGSEGAHAHHRAAQAHPALPPRTPPPAPPPRARAPRPAAPPPGSARPAARTAPMRACSPPAPSPRRLELLVRAARTATPRCRCR